MSLKMQGMNELLSKLDKMVSNAEQVKDEALQEGAEVIRKAIETNTPRSEIRKKHAADNIIISEKSEDGIVEIGPHKDHWYLRFPEFGTKNQPAQAFMERAYHSSKSKAQQKIAERIRKEVER